MFYTFNEAFKTALLRGLNRHWTLGYEVPILEVITRFLPSCCCPVVCFLNILTLCLHIPVIFEEL